MGGGTWSSQFSAPAFCASLSLEAQPRQAQSPLLSPQQQVRKLRSFRDPLRCLSLVLKTQIGGNWEDFVFPGVKSHVLSAVASTLN